MAAPAAYVLSLIAGVLVILNGLLILAVGRSLDVAAFNAGAALGVAGILLGCGILFAASRLNARPAAHVGWGAAVTFLSLLSLVVAGGGFILGTVMGLGGGVLAIAWQG